MTVTLNVGLANNIPFNTGKGLQDNNGNPLLLFGVTASAVNYLTVTNNVAGSNPSIAATGSDTNIYLTLFGKGTGGVSVQGARDGTNAAATFVGEYVSSQVLSGSAISLTTNVVANVTSISLTPGDYDIYGNVSVFVSSISQFYAWCSTTSATAPDTSLRSAITGTAFGNLSVHTPFLRVNVTTTTTVYLSTLCVFTGTVSAAGGIFARRRR